MALFAVGMRMLPCCVSSIQTLPCGLLHRTLKQLALQSLTSLAHWCRPVVVTMMRQSCLNNGETGSARLQTGVFSGSQLRKYAGEACELTTDTRVTVHAKWVQVP
jgi:hypothetical protein